MESEKIEIYFEFENVVKTNSLKTYLRRIILM